jgi:hypothetical protein
MAYQAFCCAFGVKGGIDETNLSAYLLAPVNTQNYICLDAGTINAGIEKPLKKILYGSSRHCFTRIHKRLLYFSCTFRSCFWFDYQLSS